MNLDDAIGTIISRGFTERQARFLVLVARHSGVCVMRQHSRSQAWSSATPRGGSSPNSNASGGSRPTTARASERASTTCAIGSVRGHRRCRVPPQASAHGATRARAHHAARRHPEGAGPRLVGLVRGEDDARLGVHGDREGLAAADDDAAGDEPVRISRTRRRSASIPMAGGS